MKSSELCTPGMQGQAGATPCPRAQTQCAGADDAGAPGAQSQHARVGGGSTQLWAQLWQVRQCQGSKVQSQGPSSGVRGREGWCLAPGSDPGMWG